MICGNSPSSPKICPVYKSKTGETVHKENFCFIFRFTTISPLYGALMMTSCINKNNAGEIMRGCVVDICMYVCMYVCMHSFIYLRC